MDLILVADNIRSIENTGALFRLADGVGARELVLVGITPYPDLGEQDTRRPWLKQRMTERLRKTALSGFEVPCRYFETQSQAVEYLRSIGAYVVAVEQTYRSVNLLDGKMGSVLQRNDRYKSVAIVVGHEVEGVSRDFIEVADICVEIPMYGKGKSLNVSVAAGVASYFLKHLLV